MAYYAPFYRPMYYGQQNAFDSFNQINPQFQAPQPSVPPNQNNTFIWVQGEAGAKSYLVPPGNTVMLMDSEASCFYLKSADVSGMPLPLRVFKYEEIAETTVPRMVQGSTSPHPDFITREEFEQRLSALTQSRNELKGDDVENA